MNLYLVTGASRGLGKAIVDFALKQGDQVVAIARSPIQKAKNLIPIQRDLSDVDGLENLIQWSLRFFNLNDFQSIHLINNAGVLTPAGPVTDLKPQEIQKNIEINLIAPMFLTNAFLTASGEAKSWRIVVNVSSGVADNAKSYWSTYSAAKAGLKRYSQALALEMADQPKVKIISFNPGVMDTAMQEQIRAMPKEQFPDVERFKVFKNDGNLLLPETVARGLLQLLANPEKIDKVDVSARDLF